MISDQSQTAASTISAVGSSAQPPPNVLLVVLDTVPAQRLSLYGYPRVTSPRLTELAQRGMTFTQARSTAPWTLPSHSSMLTGRWVHEHQAGMDQPLDRKYPTLAEFLSGQGYTTGGFVANTTYCGAETGLDRGFNHYADRDVSLVGCLWLTALGRRIICPILMPQEDAAGENPWQYNFKNAGRIKQDVLTWVDTQSIDRPFFAFVNIFDAHDPYITPDGREKRFGSHPSSSHQHEMIHRWYIVNKSKFSPDDTAFDNDCYDDCLAYVDEELGSLLEGLEQRGKLSNTLVIITSDHGEHFGEHGLYGHGSSLYDQEVRVPLVVVPPGGLNSPLTITAPVSLRNIPATIADALELADRSPFPGESLNAYRAISSGKPEQAVLSEVDAPAHAAPNQGRSPVFRGPLKSVTRGRMTLIRNSDGCFELYDVISDPQQTRDLAADPASAAILADLRLDLEQLLK